MRDRVAGKRYAEALFGAAKEAAPFGDAIAGKLEEIAFQLKGAAAVFEKDARVMQVLKSPKVDGAEKYEFIDKAFSLLAERQKASGMVVNFIKLLVRKNRIDKFFDAVGDFRELLDKELGHQEAEVTTVVALDEMQISKLKSILSNITKRKVELKERVDVSILGGVIVKMGDTIIDDSVRNRLKEIREALKAANVS